MRFSIAIVSLALFLSSCDSEAPAPPLTPSTPSTSPNDSPPPESSVSRSSETESARAESQSVGSTNGASGSGDPAEGEALFNQPTIAGVPGCVVCHSLEPGVRMVGPSMANAATLAAEAVDEMSAEDYLRQSIIEPDAHITEGFTPGLMFQAYGDALSTQQIDDLVAFLMTQT